MVVKGAGKGYELAFSRNGKLVIDISIAYLLSSINNRRSLADSVQASGMSERDAKKALADLSRRTGHRIVARGKGDAATLTSHGRELLLEYSRALKIHKEHMHPEWKGPTLTADGIVINRGKVLLIRRGNPPWKGMNALPGGYIREGERAVDCAVREVREETGITVSPLWLVGVYDKPDRDPRGHIITVAYLMKAESNKSPRGGDDAASARYHPLSRLPRLAADHARIIDDAVQIYNALRKK